MEEDYPKTSGGRRSFALLGEQEIFALARQKMEDEKRFLEPYLTLDMLAAEMNVHRNALSAAVNCFAGVMFPVWVASYRIAEVERLFALPESRGANITVLALKAGFPSRTSFYRAFNKLRRTTPGEALRKHKNKNKTE